MQYCVCQPCCFVENAREIMQRIKKTVQLNLMAYFYIIEIKRGEEMKEQRTRALMECLANSKNMEQVLQTKKDEFLTPSLADTLKDLLDKKRLTRAAAIKNSLLNNIYGHQIFQGVRTPSRDKLLALGFGMKLEFNEMDDLLKTQGYARLYARNERDAIIIYGLLHHIGIMDINTMLYENNMETLN